MKILFMQEMDRNIFRGMNIKHFRYTLLQEYVSTWQYGKYK
jgi:hypothetical protein